MKTKFRSASVLFYPISGMIRISRRIFGRNSRPTVARSVNDVSLTGLLEPRYVWFRRSGDNARQLSSFAQSNFAVDDIVRHCFFDFIKIRLSDARTHYKQKKSIINENKSNVQFI